MGMGSWNAKTSPGAKAYFDAHVEQVRRQGARPLGERPLLGRPRDPDSRRSSKVGLDRKAMRDYIADDRAQDHHRQDPLQGQREHRARRASVEPVAERRVRGGLAAEACATGADARPEAGLEVTPHRPHARTREPFDVADAWLELARLGPDHRRHLRAGRARPEPAVRADAHPEHRARRVPDARRLPHLVGAHRARASSPLRDAAGVVRCC